MTQAAPHYGSAFAKKGRISILSRVFHAAGVAQQRRRLANLDDAQLRDIGLTRAEALAESRRPAWDAPTAWKC
ncbi:MAG: DUF1127 domain-containing protein [Pseudomonadota bacterium]|jgi:uncharacterized protein YjiS (DUF1127 family)|uniref:Uncharacterized protein YjiS (DUF1127 family) n=1 Tax=Actibacterium naphthalenivorans TaxID=1614693 RepID=A0A840CET6_9RHOB|nr:MULTISPECIES: DUF1127 domain-containing protein [Actibacterium]ALG89610.1 hypothetical protein TQ29_04660 [Actibacterium sp. EMB200-NS6]KGB82869.1 hypothetical protein JT55_05375 [Rhodovulum sp. NI22]MBB4020727.1 uncharacterized protein YjiS (DUF1127 family) [Actibacterium naphthalenivorans]MDY6857940.1 DUF1127 domain-containing protein [Pseudomonadota bacterium]